MSGHARHVPFAIAVAPNGARRTTDDHPRLPMKADEIARDAAESLEAGAAMIHLHVRDADGEHVLDAGLYGDAVAAVRQAVGDRLVIQITTEAVGRYSPAEQMAVVDAVRPEAVSIALREILPGSGRSDGSEATVSAFLERTAAYSFVQIIIYEAGELARLEALAARGVLPDRFSTLAVLGRYGAHGATQAEMDAYLAAGFAGRPWMVCAFGPREADFAAQAAAAGGHARVGFENNLWLPDGTLAPSNGAIVAATAEKAAVSGRALATADELRASWR